jgi:cytochrome P450
MAPILPFLHIVITGDKMRKVCVLELLSAKRVQSFSSLREAEVDNLIESIHSSSGSPINFSEHIFNLTSTIVSRAAFGSKCKDQNEFRSLVNEIISLSGGFELPDLFPSQKIVHVISGMKAKLEKIHRKIDKILENIIHEHRENKMSASAEQEDFVDGLLGLQQSGKLEFPITTNNIKAIILVSIYAIILMIDLGSYGNDLFCCPYHFFYFYFYFF